MSWQQTAIDRLRNYPLRLQFLSTSPQQETEATVHPRMELTKEWITSIEGALAALDDKERLVLDRFYIHPSKGSVEQLRDELSTQNITDVYRLKDRALRKFTMALYGWGKS